MTAVLCLNAGSSSLKFSLFTVRQGVESPLARGAVEGIGAASSARLVVGERRHERATRSADFDGALDAAFALLGEDALPPPDVVAHRIVHGGPDHTAPSIVDEGLVQSLRRLVPWAPLHLPAGLDALAGASERFPGVPQVACFDTAFHRTLPDVARRLPIPEALHREGVRRYGFHGLSYEHVVAALGAALPARAVVAHLGSGSSLVALQNGAAVDTTMGFTPAGGVPMGSRTGDLDPGVLLYLARERGYGARELERLVERESGLVGVGGSADMKVLLERAPTDEHARLAVELYCYSVRKSVAALTAALGGIELLVFTGGIGEHGAEIRAGVCQGLEWLGVALDPARNRDGAAVVSEDGARVTLRVVPADEERVMARHAARLLAAPAP
jgi:acetate kinase